MKSQEQDLAHRSSGKRYFELDALRGIAACVVVLHHLREVFYTGDARWFLRPFVDGNAAVILFFVLSGYVLSLSYWRGRQLPYPQYLVRRFFRIYVPYACACLLAVAVARPLLYARLPLTPWFYATWHTALTFKLIFRQLVTMSISPEINTAFWSLRYEVELSIVFPAICCLLTKLKPRGACIVGIVCAAIGITLLHRYDWYSWQAELGHTIAYSSCFIFGALMAWKSDFIRTTYSRATTGLKVVVAIAAIASYLSMRMSLTIPGACLLIIFAQHSIAAKWLRHAIPEYLGKISYSLYLIHSTVLFASMVLLYGRISLWLIVVIYLAVSLALAHLFNLLIEDRADKTGKLLAARMSQPRIIPRQHPVTTETAAIDL